MVCIFIVVEICFQLFTRLKGQMTITLGALKVTHHPFKFGGHRHCGIGDIIVLVCHVISQNTRLKGQITLWAEAT